MKNFIKNNKSNLIIIIIVVIIFCYFLRHGSETSGKWQGIYYPDGCLDCQQNYIYSPFYETVNECINWVESKNQSRGGTIDSAECAYDCKKKDGFLVCKETVDVLGKASF